eukprot:6179070-Pleurochrysis_carterae.AAC.1
MELGLGGRSHKSDGEGKHVPRTCTCACALRCGKMSARTAPVLEKVTAGLGHDEKKRRAH